LVQGGLSGFVRFWLSELRASRSAPERIACCQSAVRELADYAGLSVPSRRAALEAALGRLTDCRTARPPERPSATGHPDETPKKPSRPTSPSALRPRTADFAPRLPLDTPLEQIKGVGPSRAKALGKLGLRTYGDLLTHFPTRHEHYPPPRAA